MAVATIKFSQFANGGVINDSDLVVGLQSGINSYFVPGSEPAFWSIVTTNTQMSANQGYIVNSASPITLNLPLTSLVGDEIAISSLGMGGWIVSQNNSQSITLTWKTTIGVGGSISSTSPTDSLRLVCVVENLQWTSSGGPQGNINSF